MNLKERAAQLKTDLPAIFIALKRKETPFAAKFFAGVAVVYALSPVDLIPDFIPVLGYLDDILILPVFIALAIRLIPRPLFEECRKEAQGLWSDGNPKKWYYALPMVLIWLLLIVIIAKALLPVR